MNYRHAYLGPNIDAEVVHRQARDRMTDKHRPDERQSTVVHHHPHRIPCKDNEHTVYDYRDQSVKDKIYVEDGFTMWGQPDPAVKR